MIKFSESGAELTGPPTERRAEPDCDRESAADAQALGQDKPNTYDPSTLPPELRSKVADADGRPPTTPIRMRRPAAALARMPLAVAVVADAAIHKTGISRPRQDARIQALDEPAVVAVAAELARNPTSP